MDDGSERLEPLRHVTAGELVVTYFEDGPPDGRPVILLHGFPYDVHSFVEVAPRLARAEGASAHRHLEARLAGLPPIPVPAVTLDGLTDGNFPATDAAASAAHFTGPRVHRHVPDAGHNLPQEAPEAFAAAVEEVARLSSADAAA